MFSPLWVERLLRIPGTRRVKAHLLSQGHTEDEANVGAVMTGILFIFLGVVIFNSFIYGIIRNFFQGIWEYCSENPTDAMGVGIFGTLLFLAVLFQWLSRSDKKKNEKNQQIRRDRHKIEEKRAHIQKGATGNMEEIVRFYLGEKYPDIEIKSVHVVDMVPRVRFMVRRFNTELGGKVDKNYEMFRDTLFQDTLRVLEVAFSLAENIPAVIVDAMMSFISGKAKYYDGMVLSVKAQRDVFVHTQEKKLPPFKALTSFDLRYNDGMEVKPLPEDESKSARVIERIKENAPKLNIRYED